MPAKLAKDDVQYSTGHLHSHCGKTFLGDTHYCRHFIAHGGDLTKEGRCEIVAGPIDRTYWCDRWQRVKM